MTTFFLILLLLDSAQFGFAQKPRLGRVSEPRAVATGSSATSPVYFIDGDANLTRNPIDQSDKFSAPCPIDAKKRGLHCPE